MTDFAYLLAFLFIFAIPAIIVIAMWRRNSEDIAYEKKRKEQRYQYLRGRFSSEGTIIDQVMSACMGDSRVRELFNTEKYEMMGLERRRQEFSLLCLNAVYGHGTVDGLMLSKESVNALRALIWALPGAVQDLYNSIEKPLADIDVRRTPFRDRFSVTRRHEKSYRERQEELLNWSEIPLPENEADRVAYITELVTALSRGELTLRFRRYPTYGRQIPAFGTRDRQEENS